MHELRGRSIAVGLIGPIAIRPRQFDALVVLPCFQGVWGRPRWVRQLAQRPRCVRTPRGQRASEDTVHAKHPCLNVRLSRIVISMFDPNDGIASTARAKQLGARLRELRLQRNITQAELARATGVSRPTLAALERDGRGTVETLASTLYALGRESELDSLLMPDPPSTLLEVVRPLVRRRARS